jgi:uncharacterized 2Fe-2S/4Fe-4S cluster protein (DUF4445 family)
LMTRIQFALDGSAGVLTAMIREQVGAMVSALLGAANCEPVALTRVVIVGNTVMHHLFCGIDVSSLARTPFESADTGLKSFTGAELNWSCSETSVNFLPCLGGFVGSDLLAGILCTRVHESDALQLLIDLGTNGEIVLGNRAGLLCASTAAGPAFEGARISKGMRAMTGAISEVRIAGDRMVTRVIGDVEPRGICGSGLVDAVVAGRELGCIDASGRLRQPLRLSPQLELTQGDVREVQLAKGAIAAGIQLLLKHAGAAHDDVARVYLAGAFGNYINRENARRLGLLEFPLDRIHAAGNTALFGAKLALFDSDREFTHVRRGVRHVALADDVDFERVFVSSLRLERSAR